MSYFEEIFTTILWNKLKDRIRGSVYCKIEDDVLTVRIKKNNITYERIEENIAWRIASGEINSRDVAACIVREYTQLIINETLKEYIK